MSDSAANPIRRNSSERASVLDVFENRLGVSIAGITDHDIESLLEPQADELVEELDFFLAAAADDDFPGDAISLDGSASPIIVPFDSAEFHTTRRAKQVSLIHSEVVIPLQEVSLEYDRFGRDHLVSFCGWVRRNEKLLRKHVFTLVRPPDVLDAFDPDQLAEMGDWIVERIADQGRDGDLVRSVLAGRTGDLAADLSPVVYATIQDAFGGGALGASLSFTHAPAGRIYQFCADTVGNAFSDRSSLFGHSALLHDLELPAIDDVSDDDFVCIRLQSEDFAELRDVLERALGKTAKAIEQGGQLDASFRDNLGEVRWRAEFLRRDTKDKSLSKFLKPRAQSVAIGSIVSTLTAAAAEAVQGPPNALSLAARFGVSTALGTIAAMLTYTSPKRQSRLLRFYDVLLDERPRK